MTFPGAFSGFRAINGHLFSAGLKRDKLILFGGFQFAPIVP